MLNKIIALAIAAGFASASFAQATPAVPATPAVAAKPAAAAAGAVEKKVEAVKAEAAKPAAAYVTLFPALVGNFGPGPRLQYYKADIALRVSGSEAETKVAYHEPLIRNQLIELFSQQTQESLATLEAKEALRQEALRLTRQVLEQEEGQPLVEDLLFNNLIVQP